MKPQLGTVYSISTIKGYVCKTFVDVMVSSDKNVTEYRILPGENKETAKGIFVEIIGTYDQPTELIDEQLMIDHLHKEKAFLVKSAPRNMPIAGFIGDIQASVPIAKDFIFVEHDIRCHFIELKLRCRRTESLLEEVIRKKEKMLPLSRFNHKMDWNDRDGLFSELLTSAPLKIHLEIHDRKITLSRHSICPKFKIQSVKGCYNCKNMARVIITARSVCMPGAAEVTFVNIPMSTKSVHLETSDKEIIITFVANVKCIQEKLCLSTSLHVQCEAFHQCLDEPYLELYHRNSTETFTDVKVEGMSFLGGLGMSWVNPLTGMISSVTLIIGGIIALYVMSFLFSMMKKSDK